MPSRTECPVWFFRFNLFLLLQSPVPPPCPRLFCTKKCINNDRWPKKKNKSNKRTENTKINRWLSDSRRREEAARDPCECLNLISSRTRLVCLCWPHLLIFNMLYLSLFYFWIKKREREMEKNNSPKADSKWIYNVDWTVWPIAFVLLLWPVRIPSRPISS